MKHSRCLVLTSLLMAVVSGMTHAQSPEPADRTDAFVGISGATYYIGEGCCGPRARSGNLGIQLGLQHRLSGALSWRAVGTVNRNFSMADDISICYRTPLDGCYPDPLFPRLLLTAELQLLVKPFPNAPVSALAGFGASRASDARRAIRSAHPSGLDAEMGLVARTGLELTLGRSPSAPRLQWTRTHFRRDPYSLSKAEALTVLFWP